MSRYSFHDGNGHLWQFEKDGPCYRPADMTDRDLIRAIALCWDDEAAAVHLLAPDEDDLLSFPGYLPARGNHDGWLLVGTVTAAWAWLDILEGEQRRRVRSRGKTRT